MSDAKATLLRVLAELSGRPSVSPTDWLRADLGLTSMQLIDGLARFEAATRIDLGTPLERLGTPVERVSDLLAALGDA